MRVVFAEVVKEHGDVVHDATLSIALVMRCPDVKAGDIVVVNHFAIVGTGRVEGTVLTGPNATQYCIVMVCLMLMKKRPYFTVYFEEFENISFPPDYLIEKLIKSVFTGEQIELFI